jgi:hypothetical protein
MIFGGLASAPLFYGFDAAQRSQAEKRPGR